MQNYPILDVIKIPQHIEIGELIGREGRNIRPISERTNTLINVNTNTEQAQIEIKYNLNRPPPSDSQVDEAKAQLNYLIKRLVKEKEKKDKKKKKDDDVAGFLDDFGGSSSRKYQKEIEVKKERQKIKQKNDYTIKLHMEGRGEEADFDCE